MLRPVWPGGAILLLAEPWICAGGGSDRSPTMLVKAHLWRAQVIIGVVIARGHDVKKPVAMALVVCASSMFAGCSSAPAETAPYPLEPDWVVVTRFEGTLAENRGRSELVSEPDGERVAVPASLGSDNGWWVCHADSCLAVDEAVWLELAEPDDRAVILSQSDEPLDSDPLQVGSDAWHLLLLDEP